MVGHVSPQVCAWDEGGLPLWDFTQASNFVATALAPHGPKSICTASFAEAGSKTVAKRKEPKNPEAVA